MTLGVPGPAGPGTVTVSMPYWRTPGTVRAAVLAVLGQTHTDLRLYLTNDGDTVTPPWDAVADITDPRLIRVDLPTNRGRYFCDAAVLAATRAPWFAIHDADDIAAPDWLAALQAACTANAWVAAFAPQYVVRGGVARLEPVLEPFGAGLRLRQIAHHAGVYRADSLREVGGPHPGYRIGYDTLLVNLVALHGPIGALDRPLYTRNIRPGSLVTSPLTGMNSKTRQRVRRDLNVLWAAAWNYGPGTAVRATIPLALAAEVTTTANHIRALTGEQP